MNPAATIAAAARPSLFLASSGERLGAVGR